MHLPLGECAEKIKSGRVKAQLAFMLLTVTLAWGIFIPRPSWAAGIQVSSRSDILSNSNLSATSNHQVAFTVNNSIVSQACSTPPCAGTTSSTLTLTFPAGFSLSAVTCNDIDIATGTQFLLNVANGDARTSCPNTGTSWGVLIDSTNRVITFTSPTSAAAYTPVTTGTAITISIGANATSQGTGSDWITNPSAAGIYTISVGGTFNGSGNMLVSINAAVTVQATVAESLSLTVWPTPSIQLLQKAIRSTDNIQVLSLPLGYPQNNTASSLLVVVGIFQTSNGPYNVSDSLGNAYTVAVEFDDCIHACDHLKIWYAKNAKAGANTVTLSTGFSSVQSVQIYEYSGADLSSPLDKTGTASLGLSSSWTVSTGGAAAYGPELVFAVADDYTGSTGCAPATLTPGSGYTMELTATTTNWTAAGEDKSIFTGGVQSATFIPTIPDCGTAAIVTFKAASGTGYCGADDGATVNQIVTTATSIPFGTISPNVFYQACQDLQVSTNAGNGYSLTVQESAAMKTANGNSVIPDTTCDAGTCSESVAAAWTNAAMNGLGHTCFNQSNHDCNSVYSSGTLFRQAADMSQGETAQAVMSSSTPATATGRIKYRLSAGSAQSPGAYSTTITYIITGTY